MNIENSLTSVSKTGKVSFGSNSTIKNLRDGRGKLIIISATCPSVMYSQIKQYSKITNIPVFVFKGSSQDLGNVCLKPFPVSAMTVFEPGDSDILSILK